VAALVERHFGREAVDRLADPLLSGIFGGDSAQLSARTVLPRLVEMESEYGSLTRGMLAAHRKMRAAPRLPKKTAMATGSAQARRPRSIFTALRGGMQQLVDALAARLDPASVRLPRRSAASKSGRLEVEVAAAQRRVLRRGHHGLARLGRRRAAGPVDAALGEELSAIPYSSSITVNLVYDEDQLGRLPDGFGFLVPAVEGRAMLACTFVHRKFLGRTPPGKAVLRAFLGGMKNEALLAAPDAELVATVRRELSEILGEVIGRNPSSRSTRRSRAGPRHGAVRRRPPGAHAAHRRARRRAAGTKAGRQRLRRHRHSRLHPPGTDAAKAAKDLTSTNTTLRFYRGTTGKISALGCAAS
jgi:oxygen-dependent protoporphyrinogen oxidase